jgi:type I restriction-modification system DNA methylase subunit
VRFLKPETQERIADTYYTIADIEGFALTATLNDIRANYWNSSIPLYVRARAVKGQSGEHHTDALQAAIIEW